MNASGTPRDDAYEGRALVAAFPDPDRAREAARQLRDEGFHRAWIGSTRGAGDGTASSEDDSLAAKIGRFFGSERTERSLYEELVRHGVAESEARRLDGTLPPDSAVLTVDGANHPELAAELIEAAGGHIVAGETFGDAAGAETTELGTPRGSEILGYGEARRYARGEPIGEEQRLRLREERLQIDTLERSAGEARITKDVVEHRQDVDVPVVHEELFVERRPVGENVDADAEVEPITEGQTIRIPLMRQEIAVTKRPVVTGEVVVGKRRVTETQRVAETTREERVKADGPEGTIRARGYDGDAERGPSV